MDASAYQERLVNDLVARDLIHSKDVEAAFRAVPRHAFLPGVPLNLAYSDHAIPTKTAAHRWLSSSSQPGMMAIMLEQLDLAPGIRVLEIGAGSGYNAALLAHLVGPAGKVTTLDVDADTAGAAQQHLVEAGVNTAEVVCADGRQGYPPNAPYDRIIAAAAIGNVPGAWLEQLADGGIVVAPIGDASAQRSVAFVREGDRLVEHSSVCCSFMLMRDAAP